MRNPSKQTAIDECVRQFEATLQRMALRMVESSLRLELERRGKRLNARARKAPSERAAPTRELSQPVVPSPTVHETSPVRAGRKTTWTRDAITEQLMTFLMGGTAIDAAFISRHGPRGLVAAAKKEFGRFEAAMNVASLRVSQLHPDGAPRRHR